MATKEEFKNFAKMHPELIESINDNTMTWQKYYELYDIYKDDEEVWKPYLTKKSTTPNLKGITDMVKNINTGNIQKHLDTAKKAIDFLGELSNKGGSAIESLKGPAVPRPITKFFGD